MEGEAGSWKIINAFSKPVHLPDKMEVETVYFVNIFWTIIANSTVLSLVNNYDLETICTYKSFFVINWIKTDKKILQP